MGRGEGATEAYTTLTQSILLDVQEGYEKALSCNGEELEGRTLKVRSGGRALRVSPSSTTNNFFRSDALNATFLIMRSRWKSARLLP